MIALCILLFAAGHLVRDGWPPIGHTNLGARPLGGAICTVGALCAHPSWVGLAFGLATLASFWTDQKHGEGQGGATWKDAAYLSVSGVTSLAPVALVAGYLHLLNLFFVLIGLVKAPIWFFWWRVNPMRWWRWAQPTRCAAMTFGATVGAIVALI